MVVDQHVPRRIQGDEQALIGRAELSARIAVDLELRGTLYRFRVREGDIEAFSDQAKR